MCRRKARIIEFMMFFIEKMTARKNTKNNNQTYFQTSKQSASFVEHWINVIQCDEANSTRKKRKICLRNIFFHFCSTSHSSWWIVMCQGKSNEHFFKGGSKYHRP